MQLAFELGSDPGQSLSQPYRPPRTSRPAKKTTHVDAKSILAKATGRIDSFDFSLNPYRGCQFGCSYCYAAFFQPEPERVADWGEWVEVKQNALALLRKDSRVPGAKILIGSATDAYQPVELQLGLTRSLLEYMAALPVQPRIVIQTRSPIVARDIDILKQFKNLRVNLSITTDDEEVRKAFEPKTASIRRRIETAHKLVESGIPVGICVSPMLPLTNPEEFGRRLKAIGAQRYTASAFHRNRGAFRSNTGAKALQLANEMNWGGFECVEALVELRKSLPEIETKGLAFLPT